MAPSKPERLLPLLTGLLEGKIQPMTNKPLNPGRRWQDAIAVAAARNHPDKENLRRTQYQWLLKTGQEGKAGEVKETEGDLLAAITLYLKGGMPGKAAAVVAKNPTFAFQVRVCEMMRIWCAKEGQDEEAFVLFLFLPFRSLFLSRKGFA